VFKVVAVFGLDASMKKS